MTCSFVVYNNIVCSTNVKYFVDIVYRAVEGLNSHNRYRSKHGAAPLKLNKQVKFIINLNSSGFRVHWFILN